MNDITRTSKELLDALKYLVRHYVGILEHGRNRILDLGGTCDPVDVMERSDPHLRVVREVIAKHEAAVSAHEPRNAQALGCLAEIQRCRSVGDPHGFDRAMKELTELLRGATPPPGAWQVGDCVVNWRGRKGVLHSVSEVRVRWQDGGMTSVPASSLERRDCEEADRAISPALTKPGEQA